MPKAIALFSGGLDSILAVKIILQQGIEVEAVNFLMVFLPSENGSLLKVKKTAHKLGVNLKIFDVSKDLLEIIKHPKYGYGKNMNPCIDCRIYMLKKAAEYMKHKKASFLITGEVLGERPMSQRKEAMKIIEKEVGLEGLILRPLSANILAPTIPEKEGWIKREKLFALKGASRKPQIDLAHKFGLSDYPSPAGGCLLTDPQFAQRFKDLLKYDPHPTLNDIQLLKIGRHFRLSQDAKIIVGRNEEENKKLLALIKDGDFCFKAVDFPGPLTVGRGSFPKNELSFIASLTARYTKGKEKLKVSYRKVPSKNEETIIVSPTTEDKLSKIRV